MSDEANVAQIDSSENTNQSNLIHYSTRLVERNIERALDIIYEQTNDLDPKIYEWRHSADKINISNN